RGPHQPPPPPLPRRHHADPGAQRPARGAHRRGLAPPRLRQGEPRAPPRAAPGRARARHRAPTRRRGHQRRARGTGGGGAGVRGLRRRRVLLVAGLGGQGLDPAPPQSLTGGAGGVSPIAKHVSGLVCGRPDPSHARSGVTYPCGNSGRFGASILKDMAQNRVTISDLAREAGVNKSAVSRALSGKPGVSEETRARVVELARKHGWRPNSTARALSRAESGAVGWVVRRTPKSSTIDPYFMDLLIGVQ